MDANSSIHYAGLSDRGRVRALNEDRWSADPDLGLYVVADGVGGGPAGDVAAEAVVCTLPPVVRRRMAGAAGSAGAAVGLPPAEAALRLRDAIADLSTELRKQSQGRPGLDGMGATVVLALLGGPREGDVAGFRFAPFGHPRRRTALTAHMGDSRAYRLRGGASGNLDALTRDHSLERPLRDAGELSPDASAGSVRGVITRHVGMPGEPVPEVRTVELEPGDRLLLCSDGLFGMVGEAEIREILARGQSPEATCRALVDAANGAGGADNITVVVVDV